MGSAFTLAFPNKVAEWAVAILAMLRTYSDALTKNRARNRFPYISKNKIAGLDACDIWVGDYWYLSK
jgi:hypothetical protein